MMQSESLCIVPEASRFVYTHIEKGRFLKLNQRGYEEVGVQGSHDKKKAKGKRRKATKKTKKPTVKKADGNDMFGEVE